MPLLSVMMSCQYENLPSDLLEHIQVQGDVSDFARSFGWGLLKGLCQLIDGLYEALQFILGLNIYNIPGIQAVVKSTQPVVWALLGLAITIGAIYLMIHPDKLKMSDFARNIMTAAIFIIAMPFTLSVFNDLKSAGVNDVNQINNTTKIGQQILQSLTIDVDASQHTITHADMNPYAININDTLDNDGTWSYKLVSKSSSFVKMSNSQKLVTYFGIDKATEAKLEFNTDVFSEGNDADKKLLTEILTQISQKDQFKSNAEKILACNSLQELFSLYKTDLDALDRNYSDIKSNNYHFRKLLTADDINELQSWQEPSTWFLKEEHIYAYDYYFLNGLILVVITLLAVFFAGMKIGGLIFDVLFNQIIAPIVIATDIQGSGRAKKVIQNFISLFIIFIIVLFNFQIYLIVIEWMIPKNYALFVQIFILLGGAKFVIDGPDLVVRLLGIDAGVKSGYAAWRGAETVLRTIFNGKKMIGNTKNDLVKTAKGIASAPSKISEKAGAVAGAAKAAKSNNIVSQMTSGRDKAMRQARKTGNGGGGNAISAKESRGDGNNSSSPSFSEKQSENPISNSENGSSFSSDSNITSAPSDKATDNNSVRNNSNPISRSENAKTADTNKYDFAGNTNRYDFNGDRFKNADRFNGSFNEKPPSESADPPTKI